MRMRLRPGGCSQLMFSKNDFIIKRKRICSVYIIFVIHWRYMDTGLGGGGGGWLLTAEPSVHYYT